MASDDNNEIDQPGKPEDDEEYDLSADGSVFSVHLDNTGAILHIALIAYGLTLLSIVLVRLFGSEHGRGGK